VDVWFSPEDSEVWEIRAADLSLSPVHKGGVGKVDPVRGIGLRFPRFIRRRDDKSPADATNSKQVVTMFREQASVMNQGAGGGGGDDDDDE
jgi:DNA ligase-1